MNIEETLLKCKGFNFEPLPSYMNLITEFSNNDLKKPISDLRKYKLIPYKDLEKGIWILLGLYNFADNGIKQSKWITIEVGSSNDIIAEIRECINNMKSIEGRITKGANFYPDSELFTHPTYMTKECCKYRMIKETFSQFKWYQINPSEYLRNISSSISENIPLLFEGIQFNIINFIESHIAFTYKPLTWNPAPQTKGNKEAMLIKIFQDHKNEKLKIEKNEILFS